MIKALPEFAETATYDEFKRCWLNYQSRVFGFSRPQGAGIALVPFADMFNHRLEASLKWGYDMKRAGFFMKSMEDIPRGEQIYDSYG